VRAEIERESERLLLVKKQMDTIEAAQRQAVAAGSEPQVVRLAQLRGIGMSSGWMLAKELFGWRRFRNRREVAGCLGLTPSPYASGESETEQGISKAGNRRARTLMVELAWSWLRYQPHSELSQWFARRFAGGGKRLRRIGIVALARRLAIALWRYLEDGLIPQGAQPQAHRRVGRAGLSLTTQIWCIVRIEGQRARNGRGLLASNRPQRWGALVTGVWTQRYAPMRYVVPGLAPARIEVRPSNGLGGYNPDLESQMHLGSATSKHLQPHHG